MSSEGEYFPTAVTPVTAERTASVLPGRCLLINKKLSQRCVYMYVLLLPGATAGGRADGRSRDSAAGRSFSLSPPFPFRCVPVAGARGGGKSTSYDDGAESKTKQQQRPLKTIKKKEKICCFHAPTASRRDVTTVTRIYFHVSSTFERKE